MAPLLSEAQIATLAGDAWRTLAAQGAWNTLDCTLEIRQAIRQAVKLAGEEAAKVADTQACGWAGERATAYNSGCTDAADAIRARLG